MKTDEQLREIESSKEFKDLINESNKFFQKKQKLQDEQLNRLNKNLPLLDISEQIKKAKENMNFYYNKALSMLK